MKSLDWDEGGKFKVINHKVETVKSEVIKSERERACAILLKHIVPPDNDGYWANDLLKDIVRQIKGE